MKKFFALSVIYFAFNSIVFSQFKHDYVWVLGQPVEEPHPISGVSILNFNDDTLKLAKQNEGIGMFLTNVSFSDQDGELMFYTNGCNIFNAQHKLMENGGNLNPGDAYLTGNCPNGGNAIPQGIIAISSPIDESKVYLFHQATEYGDFGTYVAYFYYTLIDMNEDDGHGAVVEKNQLLVSDTLMGNINAIKHQNNEDWWIMVSSGFSNTLYRILLTDNGIDSIFTQEIGLGLDPRKVSQSSFSPDGTMYARMNSEDQVTLFDFDRETGELSNFQQLVADTMAFWTSLSFSPNSRYLYVSTTWKLWQFDLLAPDVQASKVLIDEYDGFTYFGFPMIFFLMQLGPDCKIYMIGSNGTKYMHVINKPDEPGLACDFRQHSLELPSINNTSIPNFPNYRLGTGYPVCDSNIVYTAGRFVPPPVQGVRVWPNPASEEVSVEINQQLLGRAPASFELFDITGRAVGQWELSVGSQAATVPLRGLANGMYFWRAVSEGRQVGNGKLIIAK